MSPRFAVSLSDLPLWVCVWGPLRQGGAGGMPDLSAALGGLGGMGGLGGLMQNPAFMNMYAPELHHPL